MGQSGEPLQCTLRRWGGAITSGLAAAEIASEDMVNSNYRELPTEDSGWLCSCSHSPAMATETHYFLLQWVFGMGSFCWLLSATTRLKQLMCVTYKFTSGSCRGEPETYLRTLSILLCSHFLNTFRKYVGVQLFVRGLVKNIH